MDAYSIGVDLGGTNLRVAAIEAGGQMLHKVSVAANYDAGPDRVVSDIVHTIQEVRSRVADAGLAGVGIGIPGFIDIRTWGGCERCQSAGFPGLSRSGTILSEN